MSDWGKTLLLERNVVEIAGILSKVMLTRRDNKEVIDETEP